MNKFSTVRAARLLGTSLKNVAEEIRQLPKFRFRNIKAWAKGARAEEENLLKKIVEEEETTIVRCKRGAYPSSICNDRIAYPTRQQNQFLDKALFDEEAAKVIREKFRTDYVTGLEKELTVCEKRLQTRTDEFGVEDLKKQIMGLKADIQKCTTMSEDEFGEHIIHEYTVNSGDVNTYLRKVRAYEGFDRALSHDRYVHLLKLTDDLAKEAIER